MKSFKLSNGYELPIVEGWREKIKSNWRKAYKEFEYSPIPIEKLNKLKHENLDIFEIVNKKNCNSSPASVVMPWSLLCLKSC